MALQLHIQMPQLFDLYNANNKDNKPYVITDPSYVFTIKEKIRPP